MIRRLRVWRDRALTWWFLDGQFSWPVRALSPGRRAVHRDVALWCAEPGYGPWRSGTVYFHLPEDD